jgi:anti-sigma regulatory factor (Ser/Thr protein kinase)
MAKRLNRSFPARLQAFDQVKVLIEEFGTLVQLGREDRHKLTLIVEELFTNTVTHGFQGDSDSNIVVTFEQTDEGVLLTYEDAAPPYDPVAAGHRTDIEATINERRVGGVGIFLALGLTQDAQYSFVDGHNRIAFTFLPKRDQP